MRRGSLGNAALHALCLSSFPAENSGLVPSLATVMMKMSRRKMPAPVASTRRPGVLFLALAAAC